MSKKYVYINGSTAKKEMLDMWIWMKETWLKKNVVQHKKDYYKAFPNKKIYGKYCWAECIFCELFIEQRPLPSVKCGGCPIDKNNHNCFDGESPYNRYFGNVTTKENRVAAFDAIIADIQSWNPPKKVKVPAINQKED